MFDIKLWRTTCFEPQTSGIRSDLSANWATTLRLKLSSKMAHPVPLLSFIFGLFSQTLQILQQYRYEKKCPSSIRCQDSNPRPLERESPPIITRPGLPKQTPCLYVCGQRLTVVTSNYLSFSSCFGPTVDLFVVK